MAANFITTAYREPSSHLKSLAQSVRVLTVSFIGTYSRHRSSVRWGFLIPLVADAGIERRDFLVMSQARYHFSNLLYNIGCSFHSITTAQAMPVPSSLTSPSILLRSTNILFLSHLFTYILYHDLKKKSNFYF